MAAAAASVDGPSGASRNTTVRRPITRSMPGAVVEPVSVPVVSDYTNAIRDREQLVRENSELKEQIKKLSTQPVACDWHPEMCRPHGHLETIRRTQKDLTLWTAYVTLMGFGILMILVGLYKCYLQYFV